MELTKLAALTEGYRSGAFDPEDVVEEVLRRIDAAGDDHVWIARVSAENMRARAIELKNSGSLAALPLYGIPFAVKDNIDIAGFATTVGCPEFAYQPVKSSPVVQRLIDAGGILVGKTNMDQFAIGLTGARSPYGTPRNPYGSDYIPGGSSSGSAVAVASGLVTFALGTDTAGSIRVPAGFTNIVGLKPTRGMLSTSGATPACRSLDCIAIMAADVSTAESVFDVTVAYDPDDPFSRSADPASRDKSIGRIGILRPGQRQFFGDEEAAAVYESGIARLRQLGYVCTEIDFAPFREAAELLYNGPWMAEREVAVGDFIARNPEAVVPATRAAILASATLTAAEGFRGYYRLKELQRITKRTWEEVDTLFVPTAPTIYKVEDAHRDPVGLMQRLAYYTNFVNLLNLSAAAVPSGFTSAGLPVGATFISPAFYDHALIEIGKRFATTVKQRVPQGQH